MVGVKRERIILFVISFKKNSCLVTSDSLCSLFEITGDSKDKCICPRQVDKPFLKSKMSFFVMYNIGLVPEVPGNSTLKGRIGVHGLSFKLRFPDSDSRRPFLAARREEQQKQRV